MGSYLLKISQRLGRGGVVNVGFLEGATYPADSKSDSAGLSVAQVAFYNEFGTSRAPARPFFRGMLARESPGWGKKLAALAKAHNYRTPQVLGLMGEDVKGALVQSIAQWPADNAPRTVARKGFNKGLIDTGVMQRAVDYEVGSGPDA